MRTSHHKVRRAAVAAVVVGMTSVGMATVGVAPSAHATVGWTVVAGGGLYLSATAGEPIVVQCRNGVVRTAAGMTTPVACAALTSLVVDGAAAADFFDLSALSPAAFPALTSTTVRGQGGNDRITGSPIGDTIYGGGGDDRILGGGGNDTIQGNLGNDRIAGEGGADQITGNDGDDQVTGGSDTGGPDDIAADALNPGNGVDLIIGQDNDVPGLRSRDTNADDIIKWSTSTAAPAFAVNIFGSRKPVEVSTGAPGSWVFTGTGDCGCLGLRRSSPPAANRGAIDALAPINLRMSSGDDQLTVVFSSETTNWIFWAMSAMGGAGNDHLSVQIVGDPKLATVTATTVTYPGSATLTYTGFEKVTVVGIAAGA